jgi:hypothetical protein
LGGHVGRVCRRRETSTHRVSGSRTSRTCDLTGALPHFARDFADSCALLECTPVLTCLLIMGLILMSLTVWRAHARVSRTRA